MQLGLDHALRNHSVDALRQHVAPSGARPIAVFDFASNKFSLNGLNTVPMTTALSVANTSPKTVIDSDGKLKWAAHNSLKYSDDLTGSSWVTSNGSINSATEFEFSTSSSEIHNSGMTGAPLAKYTLELDIYGDTPGDTFAIELVDIADGSDSFKAQVTVSATKTTVSVTADLTGSTTFSGNLGFYINRTSTYRSVTAGSRIYISEVRLYKSSLGGMQANPDTGDSYVPTGASAVYLPGRDYGASRPGVPRVFESRTNLLPNSQLDGAVVGVIGSGGVLPTGWSSSGWDSVEVLEIGTHLGVPAIRVKLSLNNASGSTIYPSLRYNGFSGRVDNTDFICQTYSKIVSTSADAGPSVIIQDNGGSVGNFINNPLTLDGNWNYQDKTGTTGTGGTSLNFVYSHTVNNGTNAVVDFWISAPGLEQGNVASPYIPTSGSAVTRNADDLTQLLSNIPGWDPNEGTMVVKFAEDSISGPRAFYMDDGSSANRIIIYRNSSGNIYGLVTVGGVTQASLNLGAPSGTGPFTVALAWKANDFAGSIDGGAVITDSAGSVPNITKFGIGMTSWGTAQLNNDFHSSILYPKRLSNTDLAALSGA